MAKLVSKTYGDALFQVANDERKVDVFFEQSKTILAVLNENKDLVKLLEQPKVAKTEKIEVVEKIFDGMVEKEIIGLMVLLIEKSHYADLESVFEYFISEVKEAKRIGVAYVTSAIELNATQKSSVEKRLLETTSYQELEMNYEEDKSVIGGMLIRIGDRVMDTTIRTKLQGLNKELRDTQLSL